MEVIKTDNRNSKRILRGLLFWLSLLMIVSCQSRPKGVLSDKKMVDLMVDMEIAEAYSQQTSITPQERMALGIRVMAAHKVDGPTLDSTLVWYGRNIDDYTKLYEKVESELLARKKKYGESPVLVSPDLANLWPYSSHLIITQNSDNDVMVFSFPQPLIEKGEIVKLSFSLPNPLPGKSMIGVEYTDGSGETHIAPFSNKGHVEVELQTDTIKEVSRLYGSLFFKERERANIYIDSISLTLNPIDSISYRQKKRSQKTYGSLKLI